MLPSEFTLSVLSTLPGHKVQGKKRLQKMAMLLQAAGAPLEAEFGLHHYGPYSQDLADAVDEMAFFGDVCEEAQATGAYNRVQSVYTLPEGSAPPTLPSPFDEKLLRLDRFSTVELEVASTVRFFLNGGLSLAEALDKTSEMKPSKTIPPVIAKAKTILEIVDA